ncbi:hypothetical protein LCGC14_1861940 [marine sediment metagenome]|uniref:Uncharacterized protein n=1 Tax=marine sediment metagenome TaxID=412755 RepID=A0A0F9G7L7_9ZZZZ
MNRKSKLVAFKDPDDKGNSPKYHTGATCIVPECNDPAGTYWSPYWCFCHNVIRIDKINDQLTNMIEKLKEKR